MHISSFVQGLWVCHSSSCLSYYSILRPFAMPLFRSLRTSSHPADSDLDDAAGNTSDDSNLRGLQASGSKSTIHHRHWRAKGQLTTDHSGPFRSRSIPPSTFPTSYPAIPSHRVHLNGVDVPSPEIPPTTDAVSDKFAEAWYAVKDGPKSADTSRALPKRGRSATQDVAEGVGGFATPLLLFFHALI